MPEVPRNRTVPIRGPGLQRPVDGLAGIQETEVPSQFRDPPQFFPRRLPRSMIGKRPAAGGEEPSVQIFDILLLGEYAEEQMLTPRLRPLPGAVVHRLTGEETATMIEISLLERREDQTTNVIGELLNAADAPLCVSQRKFNYHIMMSEGSGSGKRPTSQCNGRQFAPPLIGVDVRARSFQHRGVGGLRHTG